MAFSETINTGTTPGDNKGDGLRTNMRKLIANDNYLNQRISDLELHAPEEYPDRNFLYIQASPSDTWEVTHNLNKYPAVTIIDSAGSEVKGNVKYISTSSLTITFVGAFSGKATLN